MFYLNLREMHRNPTYCWDLPAEGLEPTRSCDHWILSPARLPIPPRRRFWRPNLASTALASNVSLIRFVPDDPAFCIVRRFVFSDRIPDLRLCLEQRRGDRGVHRGKRSPNAW